MAESWRSVLKTLNSLSSWPKAEKVSEAMSSLSDSWNPSPSPTISFWMVCCSSNRTTMRFRSEFAIVLAEGGESVRSHVVAVGFLESLAFANDQFLDGLLQQQPDDDAIPI